MKSVVAFTMHPFITSLHSNDTRKNAASPFVNGSYDMHTTVEALVCMRILSAHTLALPFKKNAARWLARGLPQSANGSAGMRHTRNNFPAERMLQTFALLRDCFAPRTSNASTRHKVFLIIPSICAFAHRQIDQSLYSSCSCSSAAPILIADSATSVNFSSAFFSSSSVCSRMETASSRPSVCANVRSVPYVAIS